MKRPLTSLFLVFLLSTGDDAYLPAVKRFVYTLAAAWFRSIRYGSRWPLL